jgi:hypothetical protein
MIIDLPELDALSSVADSDDTTLQPERCDTEPASAARAHCDSPPPAPSVGGEPGGPPPAFPATAPPHAKMPETQVLPSRAKPGMKLADRHQQMIARIDEKIRMRASLNVADQMLAAQVDELSPKPPGWSDRQYRTAMDARKCGKEAPVYLTTAAKLFDSFKRVEATRPMVAPELHADVKIYVNNQNTYNYRKVDLKDE